MLKNNHNRANTIDSNSVIFMTELNVLGVEGIELLIS